MVKMASTFNGIGTLGKAKRWNKTEKSYTEVDQPEAIKYYNDFMGGVDFKNCPTSYYPMTFRRKRWPTKVIVHHLSLSAVNVLIRYRKKKLRKGLKRNQVMDFLAFREAVRQTFSKAELSPARFKGRRSFQSLLNYFPV